MKKILLIRIDALGDIILTLPAIKAIKEFYKNAEIDLVVKKNFASFMKEIGLVDNIIVWDEKKFHTFFQVRKKAYDLAFDLTPASTFDSSLLLLFASAKQKIGYAVGMRKYFLTTPIIPKGIMYELDMVLEICQQMNIPVKDKKLFFPINQGKKKEVKEKIKALLAEQCGQNDAQKKKPGKIIAVHPCASKREKMWPGECFTELVNKLIQNYPNLIFVFIGTKEEKEFCDEINQKLIIKQANFAGALSIIELGAFLLDCDLLLCNNSGPMHVGAAVGTPLIILNMVSSNERWTPKEGVVNLYNATSEDLEQCQMQKAEIKQEIKAYEVYNACVEILSMKDRANKRA